MGGVGEERGGEGQKEGERGDSLGRETADSCIEALGEGSMSKQVPQQVQL